KTEKNITELLLNKLNTFDPMKDSPESIPDEEGLYFMVLREEDALATWIRQAVPGYTMELFNGKPLLYLGISGRGLRKRDYKNHFTGNVRNSTLRKSIGALRFNLEDRAYRDEKKGKFKGEKEAEISRFMKENLVMYYVTKRQLNDGALRKIEKLFIEFCQPLLNLKENYNQRNKEFRKELNALRTSK
ncbi:MAG: hypothetical protein RR472_04825, partial [Anaerovoracaceae bacterium]